MLVDHSRDPKKQVRLGAIELLGLLLADRKFEIPPKGVAAALGALGASGQGRGVTDADGATRAAAAKAFWAAKEGYPGKLVEGFYAKLGDKERKLVEKHKPRSQ